MDALPMRKKACIEVDQSRDNYNKEQIDITIVCTYPDECWG